ncbi:MAG: protein-L-isoaspartate(D-aspartate) O-methyltransferase [candidate division Zixibacteria bacterium]|nr:protein-L-isoaspartate(D-aspartate) O-methyltransferase [candidate division Zixibacteria bacterium]
MGLFSRSDKPAERRYSKERMSMVNSQIKRRDITNQDVLDAMLKVPRHEFVSKKFISSAYDDSPLPLEYNQTISQPYIVASMSEFANPGLDKTVLEIGTGSGYQTAVLAEIFCRVVTVEYIPELSIKAQEILAKLGYDTIEYHIGDGLIIPATNETFDSIVVTAAPSKFPESLMRRLKTGGRLIVPVGVNTQTLYLAQKNSDGTVSKQAKYSVRFVPLQHDS